MVSLLMKKYNYYQVLASVSLALFIVCLAFGLVSKDRKIYKKSIEEYEEAIVVKTDTGEQELSDFEAELCYELIADAVTSFSSESYEVLGYDIHEENLDKLEEMHRFLNRVWIISVMAFLVAICCFVVLSRRRMYKSFLYGGVLAAFMTAAEALIVMTSRGELISGIRCMVLKKDYGYFAEGDIIRAILPPDFAGNLAIAYLVTVLLLIIMMVLVRTIIVLSGRPHRF